MTSRKPPQGAYVHLPWCRHRCHYCSFNVHVDRAPPQVAYTQALLSQWGAMQPLFGEVDSLYFGGGTPSLHPPDQLARVISALSPQSEVTLEANPSSTSLASIGAWQSAGITRLSLGVQTFDEHHTRFLHRAHSAAEAITLLETVAAAGFRSFSADLIFALPGQTLAQLDRDLDRLLSVEVPHVSLYGLTAHPGTWLGRAVDSGRVTLPDEDTWEAMYLHIVARLQDAGLERYEVSNFARPGHRSQHNEATWRGLPYVGLGAGAHGFTPQGVRTLGTADPAAFIADPLSWEEESADPEQLALDLLLSTLRHVDGVPLDRLRATGFALDVNAIRPHLDRGTLRLEDGHLRLGPGGWTLADGLTLAAASALHAAVT